VNLDIHLTSFWIDPIDTWTKWFQPVPVIVPNDDYQLPERIDDLELCSPIAYILDLMRRMAVDCDQLGNPYHNTNHALRVMQNVLQALQEIERQCNIELPDGLRDIIALACICHDHKHPGKTFLTDVSASRLRRHYAWFNSEITAVEQVSAFNCVDNLYQHSATPAQQLLATYLIWSTAYGGATERGKELGVDKVQPHAPLGLLMRAADVTLLCDDVASFDADVAVNYGEGGFKGSIPEYIANRRSFLNYVAECYRALDRSLDFELTSLLRWRSRLAENQLLLDKVEVGDPYALVILKTQIDKYRMPTYPR